MKVFNTTGKCIPSMHYMVDISRQVEAAAKLVRRGNFFCINRGRQYGKTTTLALLKKKLEGEGYAVFSLSFEGLGDSAFKSDETLMFASLLLMNDSVEWDEVQNLSDSSKEVLRLSVSSEDKTMDSLSFNRTVSKMSKTDKIVLLIDEVDAAGNHIEFIHFLGLLRNMYLKRDERPTFQSVILAGVYDVKNLKLKLRPEEQHQYNSPWNIAVTFDANMSLPADGIAGMLAEYKADHHIGFDEHFIGQMIYDYTSGYPFLVSRICQIIDEGGLTWDREGVLAAVKFLLIIMTGISISLSCLILSRSTKVLPLFIAVSSRPGFIISLFPMPRILPSISKVSMTNLVLCMTRDLTRTDVIIDYLGQQYVVELKIWRGELQLSEYLDYYHLQTGYMLSFCFNRNKQPGLHEVVIGDKKLYEVVV